MLKSSKSIPKLGLFHPRHLCSFLVFLWWSLFLVLLGGFPLLCSVHFLLFTFISDQMKSGSGAWTTHTQGPWTLDLGPLWEEVARRTKVQGPRSSALGPQGPWTDARFFLFFFIFIFSKRHTSTSRGKTGNPEACHWSCIR